MSRRLHQHLWNATRASALALLFLTVPATRSEAQFFGYGGYGYPGYGFGYGGFGAPGAVYGYGFVPGAVGGFGGPFGYGVAPGYGFAVPGANFGSLGNPYGAPLGTGPGDVNPLLGLGLTPLGVQSALTETNWIRGAMPRANPARPAPAPAHPR